MLAGKAFVKKSAGEVGIAGQPNGEIPDLTRLLAFAAVAVDRQADHPALDGLVDSHLLEVTAIERLRSPQVGSQRARPSSARVADGQADPHRTIIDPSQSAGRRPGGRFEVAIEGIFVQQRLSSAGWVAKEVVC